MSNDIVLENQKQGTPQNEWGLHGPPSTTIEGFATDISVNIGTTVDFKINTDSAHYRIDVYRLGYYGGDGARLVDSVEHLGSSAVIQPAALTDPNTGLVDAGNWSVTDSWNVPADAVSGVYLAKLVREDGTSGENYIPFIVRNDGSQSNIVFQTSDATWQAYNFFGGDSYYPDGSHYAVSYNRPIESSPNFPYNTVLDNEFPAIQWLERNGYDVSYIAGVDTARSPSLLLNHQVYMDAGHDEYWSPEQRAAVTAARDAGVNLEFWSGNEIFWETRWGPSIDGSNTGYRTLTTYKGNHALDPGPGWTGSWSDPSQPNGANPQNSLTGTLFTANADRHDTINVSSDFANLRFWANTSVAALQTGQSVNLSPGMLGHEWDSDIDNGFRPPGLIDLSATAVSLGDGQLFDSRTQTLGSGTAIHNMTLYRAASGALVFGAGDVFWPQNLQGPSASRDAEQAMVNLFADMGIQPETLQADLIRASQSTDRTPPTSVVTTADPFVLGQNFEIYGTAVDSGGGVVASVEVSTDNGATWHHAGGTNNWYLWWSGEPGNDTYHLMTRAVDDSLNLETPTQSTVLQIAPSGGGVLHGSRTNGDIMVGGQGVNVYEVTNSNDRVIQGAGATGSVWSYLPNYTLPPNVDILILGGGVGNNNGTGNGEGDIIIGNSADNIIDSRGGHAFLIGGSGHESFVFDAVEPAGDQTVYNFVGGDNGSVVIVRNSQFQTFNDILPAIHDDGLGNTIITLDAQHSMYLEGITRNQLVASNFNFGSTT